MEIKLKAALAAGLGGWNVSQLCAELGISRQSFYKYRRRFEAEGPGGLAERSRRPRRSPGQITPALEDDIVCLRKQLTDAGLDAGAATIASHLERRAGAVPAVSTVHRALVRRGLVVPHPEKRPRSVTGRFEWPRPNDAWQIDATRWLLRQGQEAWVMDILDDHSRVVPALVACSGPTGAAAWAALCRGSLGFGLPAHVMNDNGSCFTGRFQDGEVDFERDLRALGIVQICSSPGHPQTCGKLERFHQTLKRWLAARPRAASLEELQAQLDCFGAIYNALRPHRALGRQTPLEVWRASPPARPGPPRPAPSRASVHTVAANGFFSWRRHFSIGVGIRHAGEKVVVVARGDDLAVFGQGGLLRRFTLDRSKRHQGTGGPVGRPPRPVGPRV